MIINKNEIIVARLKSIERYLTAARRRYIKSITH